MLQLYFTLLVLTYIFCYQTIIIIFFRYKHMQQTRPDCTCSISTRSQTTNNSTLSGHSNSCHVCIVYRVIQVNLQTRAKVMVFNATFNNISVISWRSVYWWRKPEYTQKSSSMSQVTEKLLHHIMLYRIEYTSSSPEGLAVLAQIVTLLCLRQ